MSGYAVGVRRKQNWKSHEDLKQAVLQECNTKFESFAGKQWDPTWKTQLEQCHKSLGASDKTALSLVHTLAKAIEDSRALLKSKGFIPPKYVRQSQTATFEGPFTISLARWCRKLELAGVFEPPQIPYPTPDSFRYFLLTELIELTCGEPKQRVIPKELSDVFLTSPGRSAVMGRVDGKDFDLEAEIDGEKVKFAEVKPGSIPMRFIGGTRIDAHLMPAYRMPSHDELACISLLCGIYPNVVRPLNELKIGEILKLERQALRQARVHLLGNEEESFVRIRRWLITT